MNRKLSLLVALALTAYGAFAGVKNRELNDGWRFRQGRSEIWYPATVP